MELVKGLSFVKVDNICKIFINSEITEEISQNFVDLLYGLEFMKESEQIDAVIISISSSGGLLLEGYSMYSALKMSTLPISIINSGIVASIAGIIFLGVPFENRYSFENTLFMLHNSHGGEQDVLDKIDVTLSKILATAIPFNLLQQMMEDETWLNIDEQIMYNIIPFNNKLSVKEKFDISQFVEAEESNAYLIYNSINIIKNNEENMSKNILEKLKGIFNKAESEVIETKEEIFVEEVSEITESLEEVESVVESIVEDVVSEELVEAIVEPIIDPIISKSEVEILQEELLIVKELLKEKENVLLEIENSKKLELKKTFLIENKIEVTEELLKMDIEVIKPIVNSLKINKVAPSIPQITNSLNSELCWEKLSNEEKNELAKTDINLFNRIFANRKK